MDDEGQEKEEMRQDFFLQEWSHSTAQLPAKPHIEAKHSQEVSWEVLLMLYPYFGLQ